MRVDHSSDVTVPASNDPNSYQVSKCGNELKTFTTKQKIKYQDNKITIKPCTKCKEVKISLCLRLRRIIFICICD